MKINIKVFNLVLIFLCIGTSLLNCQVRLPKLIADGMVLQQNVALKIWGWAVKNENISVEFNNAVYKTIANSNGEWSIQLPAQKAGGPYKMTIIASNKITLNDILIGDVWLCSGQSNMEYPMNRLTYKYGTEIANSENPNIRQFLVPQKYDFNKAHNDFSNGTWEVANPNNILKFSAVAYFYAKEIYEKYHVPIGIINASLGGSPAEAWISEESLKEFPAYYNEAQKFKDSTLIAKIEKSDNDRISGWYNELRKKDEGYKNNSEPWYKTKLNTSDWDSTMVPGYWTSTKLGLCNGVVWYRKDFSVPESLINKPAKLILGCIVDADSVFVNEAFVGTTSYQYPSRRYDIPSNLLHKGINTIVVRIISNIGRAGFVPDKNYHIEADNIIVDLKGFWKYKLGTQMPPLEGQTFIRWKPLGLYNAMISPLLNYSIKGVVWYQGESNVTRAAEYRKLLPTLIHDWRKNWNQGNFPFIFVQLPNFLEKNDKPSESDWALMRESQLKTLAVRNTGMVVTLDLGEWNDIHPKNKKDVGIRIAKVSEHLAYNDTNIVAYGPIYKSMKMYGNKIEISFSNIGSGLISKNGNELKYFAIAGPDKNFVWAKAKIENNKVIVWNDNIRNPLAVRYAWANNPDEANLFNIEGLPASPFRTDEW